MCPDKRLLHTLDSEVKWSEVKCLWLWLSKSQSPKTLSLRKSRCHPQLSSNNFINKIFQINNNTFSFTLQQLHQDLCLIQKPLSPQWHGSCQLRFALQVHDCPLECEAFLLYYSEPWRRKTNRKFYCSPLHLKSQRFSGCWSKKTPGNTSVMLNLMHEL